MTEGINPALLIVISVATTLNAVLLCIVAIEAAMMYIRMGKQQHAQE